MRIYLSSMTAGSFRHFLDIFPDSKLNILLAYNGTNSHLKFLDEFSNNIDELMLDSGAYNAYFQMLKKIEAKQNKYNYATYLLKQRHRYGIYVNFDEVFSESGFKINYENQLFLEAFGFSPMPVIHNYDLRSEEVQFYLNSDKYHLLSLGYSANKNIPNIKALSNAFYKAGKRIHLLGKSEFAALAYAPIALCDSSSWAWPGQCEYTYFWNPFLSLSDKTTSINYPGRVKGTRNNDWDVHPYKDEFMNFVRNTFGYSYKDLVESKYKYHFRNVVCMYFYLQVQAEVTRIHKLLGYRTE